MDRLDLTGEPQLSYPYDVLAWARTLPQRPTWGTRDRFSYGVRGRGNALHLLAPGLYRATVDVLGIEIEDAVFRRWADWLAPTCQPFFLTGTEAAELGLT